VLSFRNPFLGASAIALVVAALGIILMGAYAAGSPADAQRKSDEGSTLTVVSKNRETEVVDLDPQGLSHGDMRVINSPLYDASGTERIGRLDAFCVQTDPAEESGEKAHMAQCTVTLSLPGGEITAQGLNRYPKFTENVPSGSVNAITGGTDKYAGAGGEVRLEARGNRVIGTLYFVGD